VIEVRWEDERYVRLYTRETPEWAVLSWEARAVFHELIKKVDRAGIILVGKSGLRGLAGLLRMPIDVVERGLMSIDGLIEDGCVVAIDGGFMLPNFMAAQEANASDKARKREQRERARAAAAKTGQPVTNRDSESRGVTEGHDLSRGVTSGHTESQPVTPSCAVPSRSPPTPKVTGHGVPEPGPPTPHEPGGGGGGGGGGLDDMRAQIRRVLRKHGCFAALDVAATVEVLTMRAVEAGKTVREVVDAIEHLAAKATMGAWSESRIQGALSRGVQFAKLPRSPPAADPGDDDEVPYDQRPGVKLRAPPPREPSKFDDHETQGVSDG